MAYLQMHCDKFYGSNEILVILNSPTMISAIEYIFLEIRGLEKEIKAALLMRLREGGVEIYDMIVNWLQVKKMSLWNWLLRSITTVKDWLMVL